MLQIDYPKIISNLIQKNIENIFKGVYKKGEDKYKELIIKTGSAFEQYLNTSVNKFNNVKTIIYSHKPVPLYQFYVDINIRCKDDIINTEEIGNLLEYNNCIMIFGSGGTGKSTLFKHLFLNTIHTTNLIPIFLELKNVNDKNYKSFEDFIYESLTNLNFSLEKQYFFNSLKSGQYVFFFDGYDEVKESKKQKISNEITRITNKYNKNYYFVSSRQNTMLERGWDNFCDFTMEPLNSEGATNLIRNLNYDEDIKNRFLIQLKEGALYDKHRSFCSNPLLLTIMLLTYQEFAEIPDKLHIFYGRAFDVLYSKHDATKGSFVREKRLEKKGLASDDFKNVISTFSAISYADSKITFEKESLLEYIQKAKQFMGIEFDSNDFLIDLVEAVCILTLDGSEYKYQHRSFQEYFTAKFINNLTDEDQKEFLFTLLEEKSTSLTKVDEVFNMLFEMNPTKMEKNLIIPMLEEIKSIINVPNKKESRFKFLNLMYKHGTIEHTEDGTFKCSFTVKSTSNLKYMNIVRFVARKYQTNLQNIPEEIISLNGEELFKRYEKAYKRQTENLEKNKIILELNKAKNNEKILEDILSVAGYRIRDLEISLLVLEYLNEKYRKRKSMKDLFQKTR
ncbi:NACHT domain-containing protein [Microbacteriaceae bacterium 4G12]